MVRAELHTAVTPAGAHAAACCDNLGVLQSCLRGSHTSPAEQHCHSLSLTQRSTLSTWSLTRSSTLVSACCTRDVCFATPGGFRDPVCPPWEDRRQPLVPGLAGTGDPEGQPADIPSEPSSVQAAAQHSLPTCVSGGTIPASQPLECAGAVILGPAHCSLSRFTCVLQLRTCPTKTGNCCGLVWCGSMRCVCSGHSRTTSACLASTAC